MTTAKDMRRYVVDAFEQSRLAYQFSPGSYTYGAMAACLLALSASDEPDWIAEFSEWMQ
ncbi:hypothetical protein [Pseudorhodoplanes sp.]|uniref:hypothetical protein n=1 Tax=Pseudorhodoplanes sp. TaxID=1934341 RepID=UPI002D16FEE8|nr:hypothetical protein [Pseudorhodoplanes sp.]HWV44077.1 hypothetical protein [Pseudorhodoplanes sp.]